MVEKDPKNALARFGLANELMRAGEYAEARDVLNAYLAMYDDEGAGYRFLAQACEKLGLVDEAKDAYRRGIGAAGRHNHPSMAAEFEMRIEDLDD